MNSVWTASKPVAPRDFAPTDPAVASAEQVTPKLDEKIGVLPTDRDFVAMRATWFAACNSWLDDRKTVDLLDSNLQGVLKAARADRFIAAGRARRPALQFQDNGDPRCDS